MPDLVTLSCPTCGAKLDIAEEIDRFACAHCGNEHIVKRGGGAISLSPVVESLGRVQAGVDRTASELAISRLNPEIENLKDRRKTIKVKDKTGNNLVFSLASFALGIIGISAACLMTLAADYGDDAFVPGFCGLVAAIVGVITFYVYRTASSNIRKELNAVNTSINQKEQELARHQHIVSQMD